jgi:hypothetical protein
MAIFTGLDRWVAAHHAFADRQLHPRRATSTGPQGGHEQWKGDFQRSILELGEDVPRGFIRRPAQGHREVVFAVSGVSTNRG